MRFFVLKSFCHFKIIIIYITIFFYKNFIIANIIFIAGSERYASLGSSFLIHGVKMTLTATLNLTIYALKEHLSNLERDEERIEDIYRKETQLSHEEIKSMFQAGESKDCKFAKEHGIINDIKDLSIDAKSPCVNIITSPEGVILSVIAYNC